MEYIAKQEKQAAKQTSKITVTKNENSMSLNVMDDSKFVSNQEIALLKRLTFHDMTVVP